MKKITISLIILIVIIININVFKKISFIATEKNLKEEYKDISYKEELDIENNYYGILKISNIDLEEGFYHTTSKKNKLKSGIKAITLEDSAIVLAAHSGRSVISKFNDLSKLKTGDIIDVYINNKHFKYRYEYSYKVDKTGYVFIRYNPKKEVLSLITCDISNNKKQIVYISYKI